MSAQAPALPENLVFVDLETTGPSPTRDRITEIGIVEIKAGEVATWSTLVNPGVDIPVFIQQLTGITPAMVADAPKFADIAGEVLARLKGRLFVAHNARFDYGFLKNQFRQQGLDLRATVLCTVKLSRALFPTEHKHNLDSVASRHGLEAADRHRALADADLLRQFWQKLQLDPGTDALAQAVAQLTQLPALPSHLDPAAIDDLPDGPGVYLFYGDNDLPLYIGKSTTLRKRVLSHFSGDHSNAVDRDISTQLRRIAWRETAGELGALLLESRLVKEMKPLHNRQLRENAEACAWQLVAPRAKVKLNQAVSAALGAAAAAHEPEAGVLRPRLVSLHEVDVASQDNLYGPYGSPRQAKAALRKLAEGHELCLAVLGLEKPARGAGCFGLQLKTCRGACVGKEPLSFHTARLMAALAKSKLRPWPWPGPIGIIEENALEGRRDVHVVDAWRWLGTADEQSQIPALLETRRPDLDMDQYKILSKAVQGKAKLKIVALT